jgi:integrase
LWSACRQEEVTSLAWPDLRQVAGEYHFEIVGKRGVKRWFRVPEGLFQELSRLRSDSPFVFAAYNEQLRHFHERSPRPDRARKVGAEFKPVCLGDWLYDRLADWSASLPGGHAHPHIFRKTALQQAWVGDEEADGKVAQDACVGKAVMMKHYVRVLREKSNRTFRRILAALPPELARRYGHVEAAGDRLEARLQAAIAAEDWSNVTKLSAELAAQQRPSAG